MLELAAELLQINDKFMKAKTTYDTMIEESLAKYHPGGKFAFCTITYA